MLNRFCQQTAKFFILFLVIACCGGGGGGGGEPTEPTVQPTVAVTTDSGTETFNVEIADSASERATGLMNRSSLADNAGMLFIFGENVRNSFWMKDTLISLDIIFIDADFFIVFIQPNATPLSEDLITPDQSYRYVLEVGAGFVDSSGARVGNSVVLNI